MQKWVIAVALTLPVAATPVAHTLMNTEATDDEQADRHLPEAAPSTEVASSQAPQEPALPENIAMGREQVGFWTPNPEGAKKQLEAYLARPDAAEQRARQLLRQGRLKEAEAECRHAMTLSPVFAGKPYHWGRLTLLGEILLAQRRNKEALDCFLKSYRETPAAPRKLDAALAYCRLRNLEMAQKFYSNETINETILRFTSQIQAEDLPGTSDLHSLEASILLARGVQARLQHDYEGALLDYKAARRLAPWNWVIAYFTAQVLERLNRRAEAAPYYRRALELGGDRVSPTMRRRAGMNT